MKIPEKIKIGNLIYEVGPLTDESIDDNYGKSSMKGQWIRIASDIKSHDLIAEVFFHEIIHQILESGSFARENDDEQLIDRLATSIYQVLKDNDMLT